MSEKIALLYFWYTIINGIAITLSIAASNCWHGKNNKQYTRFHYSYALQLCYMKWLQVILIYGDCTLKIDKD